MISRVWHGWTTPANADAYEKLLHETILPDIHRVAGYRGAQVLRRDAGREVEFITITTFNSMDAVRAFAGGDGSPAVVPPQARVLLSRFDPHSLHYDTTLVP
jgi:antibiotic biosynthesis monooxygenase (ABM) superfamily enzyme